MQPPSTDAEIDLAEARLKLSAAEKTLADLESCNNAMAGSVAGADIDAARLASSIAGLEVRRGEIKVGTQAVSRPSLTPPTNAGEMLANLNTLIDGIPAFALSAEEKKEVAALRVTLNNDPAIPPLIYAAYQTR